MQRYTELLEFNVTLKHKSKIYPEEALVRKFFQLAGKKDLLHIMNLFEVVYANTKTYSAIEIGPQDICREFPNLRTERLDAFNAVFSTLIARADAPPPTFFCGLLFPKGAGSNTVAKLVATSLKSLVYFDVQEPVVRTRINYYYRVERFLADLQDLFQDKGSEYRELCGLIKKSQEIFADLCTVDCNQYTGTTSRRPQEMGNVVDYQPKSLQI